MFQKCFHLSTMRHLQSVIQFQNTCHQSGADECLISKDTCYKAGADNFVAASVKDWWVFVK